jgi:hypothetical protein
MPLPDLHPIIPTWLTQIGSLAGLLTLAFTLVDKLVTGRPSLTLGCTEYSDRDVRCINRSKDEVFIRRIRAIPPYARIAKSDSAAGIGRAWVGDVFQAVIEPESHADFPLIFLDGAALGNDEGGPEPRAPFMIIMSWRKSRSMWLPQFPALLFTSAKSVRLLKIASE